MSWPLLLTPGLPCLALVFKLPFDVAEDGLLGVFEMWSTILAFTLYPPVPREAPVSQKPCFIRLERGE